MIRDLHDFWHFSRRYMKFLQVANLSLALLEKQHQVSEPARAALKRLHDEKSRCQTKIANLDLPSFAQCRSCHEGCCNDSTESYFTPIDFWLAKHGPHLVHDYAHQPVKPYFRFMRGRLLKLPRPSKRLRRGEGDAASGREGTRCLHLGENGCKLPHVERPIKCHIYVCRRLKASMDEATRRAYREAIGELYRISVETFNILKAEADLPAHYGFATLFLTF